MTMAFSSKRGSMKPQEDAGKSKMRPDMSMGAKKGDVGSEPEGMHDEKDIHQVVAEHGPANEIHIKHDEGKATHTVVSHHGGMKHHSKHGSAEEAHSHAHAAAGLADAQPEESNEPMDSMNSSSMGSIPGM